MEQELQMTFDFINQASNNIATQIDKLAEKVGGNVEWLWQITTKQVYADAIGKFCWIGIFLLAIIGISLFAWYINKKKWDEDMLGILIGLDCVAFIAFVISMIFNLTSGIKMLINPEYYALTNILSEVAKFIK